MEYFHKNQGAVAGLGLYNGVFQKGKFAMRGLPAWLAHRGYHGLAMPTWERKIRVFTGWWNNFFLRREIASLAPAARAAGVPGVRAAAEGPGARGGATCGGSEGRGGGGVIRSR